MTETFAELNFYRTERPHITAAGITDYDAQCTELKRRWDVIQARKIAPPPAPPPMSLADNEVALDEPINESDLAMMSLVLKRIVNEDDSTCKYIYVHAENLDPELPPPPSATNKRHIESALTSDEPSKMAKCESSFGLLSRLKKDTLQSICDDFGIPISGNKDELILRIINKQFWTEE